MAAEPERLGDILGRVIRMPGSATSSSDAEPYHCPDCGAVVEPVEVQVLGRGRRIRGTCRCVHERRAAEEKARAENARSVAIERRFDATWLPARFHEATLDRFEPRPGAEAALAEVRRYAEQWPAQLSSGDGLLLMGQPGNGKSHLAAGIVHTVFDAGGVAIFAKVPRLMLRFEATYRPGPREHEVELLEALIDCDLLVLDDVGAEKWTEKREERVYLIVDSRADGRRPTVATTNCGNLDDLREHVGLRTFDRLLGACLIVENHASSYRVELARRRLEAQRR